MKIVLLSLAAGAALLTTGVTASARDHHRDHDYGHRKVIIHHHGHRPYYRNHHRYYRTGRHYYIRNGVRVYTSPRIVIGF